MMLHIGADVTANCCRGGGTKICHIILSLPKETCPGFLVERLGAWLGVFCWLGWLSCWDWWFNRRLTKSFYSGVGLVEQYNSGTRLAEQHYLGAGLAEQHCSSIWLAEQYYSSTNLVEHTTRAHDWLSNIAWALSAGLAKRHGSSTGLAE